MTLIQVVGGGATNHSGVVGAEIKGGENDPQIMLGGGGLKAHSQAAVGGYTAA